MKEKSGDQIADLPVPVHLIFLRTNFEIPDFKHNSLTVDRPVISRVTRCEKIRRISSIQQSERTRTDFASMFCGGSSRLCFLSGVPIL
jgi:hypothetical protein